MSNIMKQLSDHAHAAKLIRNELKTLYPKIKFRVSSTSYSGGNSIRINYDNGTSTDDIRKITSKYKYGHFDGMYDIYEHSNVIEGLPQVKFIFIDQNITDDIYYQAFNFIKGSFDCLKNITDITEGSDELFKKMTCWTVREWLYRYLSKMDLSCGITIKSIEKQIYGRN